MSDKLAVLMEFNGYTKDELEAYLSLKFGSMTKGGMTASILSQSGYEKAKSVIFEQPTLNENQQIVLEWLKEEVKHGITPIVAIRIFHRRYMNGTLLNEVRYSYESLNEKQENRVLQAFMDWVVEQEEE